MLHEIGGNTREKMLTKSLTLTILKTNYILYTAMNDKSRWPKGKQGPSDEEGECATEYK